MLQSCNYLPVIVHGGGSEISGWCKKSGIEPQFIDGLRVTDAETMKIAQMLLIGKINLEIVTLLGQHKLKAIGLSGHDGKLIRATKHWHYQGHSADPIDLGFVGDVERINPSILRTLLANGYVPVISPIGADENGQSYNINADTVAGEIAAALQCESLLFLTDVEGVRAKKDESASTLRHLSLAQAQSWIQSEKLQGGMIPKIQASVKALHTGTSQVYIADGRVPHNILLELFFKNGVGTLMQGTSA